MVRHICQWSIKKQRQNKKNITARLLLLRVLRSTLLRYSARNMPPVACLISCRHFRISASPTGQASFPPPDNSWLPIINVYLRTAAKVAVLTVSPFFSSDRLQPILITVDRCRADCERKGTLCLEPVGVQLCQLNNVHVYQTFEIRLQCGIIFFNKLRRYSPMACVDCCIALDSLYSQRKPQFVS